MATIIRFIPEVFGESGFKRKPDLLNEWSKERVNEMKNDQESEILQPENGRKKIEAFFPPRQREKPGMVSFLGRGLE